MGIDAAYGIGSLKQGVCTSTTRPASPFEGQVIFETDTDRLYVYNGTAWVIPNSPAQNPQGLELITACTVTSAGGTAATASGGVVTIGTSNTSVTVSSAFSTTYDNYRVLINSVSCSANQPSLRLQLGATVTGYNYAGFEISYTAGSLNAAAASATSFFYIGNFGNATSMSSGVELQRPFLSENTNYSSSSGSTAWSVVQNGYLNNSTSYTAFTVSPSSGNISGGTVRVYGYRNS